MARFTPACNPTGRFPAEQHAALDSVFAAAAPLTPGEVEIRNAPGKVSRTDALVWALGELDAHVQLNSLADKELTRSDLFLRFHAIARAADELLQKLGATDGSRKQKKFVAAERWPKQVRDGLEDFARQNAANEGGFPNHPLTIIPIGDPGDAPREHGRIIRSRRSSRTNRNGV